VKSFAYMLPRLLGSLLRRPFTVKYPFAPAEVPPANRYQLVFHRGRCAFCGQCQESCPPEAIVLSTAFELATADKGSLTGPAAESSASPK